MDPAQTAQSNPGNTTVPTNSTPPENNGQGSTGTAQAVTTATVQTQTTTNQSCQSSQANQAATSAQPLQDTQSQSANTTTDMVKDTNKTTDEHVTTGVTQIKSDMTEKEVTDQLQRLEKSVLAAPLPEDLHELLLNRLERLKLLRQSSGYTPTYILEYENTSTYINWCVGLPWTTMSQDRLDLAAAKQILDKNHYGVEGIKERILEYLATIILNLRNNRKDNISRSPILCLVGLAGTGKTTLAISIAEALGRELERIPFGGMADSRVLRGQSRAFPDAEPGAIIKKLVHAKTKNPVFLLDELDRVTESARADIMGVLIELLDPGQNHSYTDHYIDYPFDLSHSLFVATANNTTGIATAVADRLEIIQMPSYTDQEKLVIAQKYIFPKIRDLVGLTDAQMVVQDDVWPGVIRPLGFDSGIRSLQRTVEGVCRKAARQIVEGKAQQVVITNANIKDFLPHW
jgi:ATP-dependent Lon protease